MTPHFGDSIPFQFIHEDISPAQNAHLDPLFPLKIIYYPNRVFLSISPKSELYKTVVMAWVGSPAQSQEPIFRNPFPRKSVGHVPKTNMAETVTRDMASSDQLKLKVLCLFRAQLSKNKSICDYAGARPQSDRSNTLIYFTLVNPQITTLQTLHATPYPTLL